MSKESSSIRILNPLDDNNSAQEDEAIIIDAIRSSDIRQNGCFDPNQQLPELQGFLRQQWLERACRSLGIGRFSKNTDDDDDDDIIGATTTEVAVSWSDRLWVMHTEESRHYHTAVHLKEMIGFLDLLLQDEKGVIVSILSEDQVSAILFAVFFHDCIYNAKSSTNEEESAEMFESFAKEVGLMDLKPDLCAKVAGFIRATKQHEVSEEDAFDLALFLDLDMSVLGKTGEAYQSYAALIRKEYNFVPREVYCTKRAEILESFLQQPRIFGTDAMHKALEQQARTNLRHEITTLRTGIIYGE